MRCSNCYGWAIGLVIASAVALAPLRADDDRQEPDVKVLVQDLASPEFEVRRLAQEQLQSMGLGAFDALLEAQFNPDVEVAHRARFILRSMAIEWVKESDSKDVKLILKNYGKADPIDRRPQIESLARLEDQRGVAALCRLSNYEFDPVLSKFAAIQVMQMDLSEGEHSREHMIRAIEVHVRPSARPASQWLSEYAHWLQSPAESLGKWKEIVDAERKQLDETSPNTSREMTGALFNWYADALRSQGRAEDSLAALRQSLDFLEPDEYQVRDAVIGLIARDAHSMVDELAGRFSKLFDASPQLLYLQAESLEARTRPSGESPPREQIDKLIAHAIELNADRFIEHNIMAEFLKDRGRFDWAEKEYRKILADHPLGSDECMRTRNALSEMLGDLERYDDSVNVLKPLIDEFAKQGLERAENFMTARYYLFRARSAQQKRQFADQKSYLKTAVELNLEDSDVIIDMYRAEEADQNWKELTRSYIKQASKQFEEQIKTYEGELAEGLQTESARSMINRRIAIQENQHAWLISNTEGDFDRAIARSRRSLELHPNFSTYQDTLARCYYAKGDYANAIKYQKMAVRQDPFSPTMRRQLALFENAAKNAAETAKDKK